MNNYKLLGRAGEGAHGFVFKGIDLRTETLTALKKITINPDKDIPKPIMREILALRVLKYPNDNSKRVGCTDSDFPLAIDSKALYPPVCLLAKIVKLLEVITVGSSVVLVMEYLPMSLYEILKDKELILTLGQIKTYIKMLLKGVNYMHHNHIMHRDIKPANLLISKKGILKIADFGLARIYDHEKRRLYSHQVATRWYRAPELLYGSRTYNMSVDMWSVGCILAEMIERKPLFPGETDIEQLAIVLGTLGTPNSETWPGVTQLPDYNKIAFTYTDPKKWTAILPEADSMTIQLISKILIYDQNKRLSAKDAIKDRFFQEKPFPCRLAQMPKLENLKSNESAWDFSEFDKIFGTMKEDDSETGCGDTVKKQKRRI